MSGSKLEAKANIITASASSVLDLRKCCAKAGFDVNGILLSPLVSAYSVLTKDERESGVLMLDIGAGTTEIVHFKAGVMKHVSVLNVGGTHITNDMAIGLKISRTEAERLKKDSGTAITGKGSTAGNIEITLENGDKRTLPVRQLVEIILPRCEEIIEMADKEIRTSFGKELSACSVVLTGGTSLLGGFDRLAEVMLGLPVRIGRPLKLRGLKNMAGSPAYSAAAGLVLYADRFASERRLSDEISSSVLKNMKDRFANVFK
jgi:cell division protein FtsA